MIETLNKHLPLELSAHTLYNGYAQQFKFWGYSKLAEHFEEGTEEELGHANAVILRILQLGGTPDYMQSLVFKAPTKRDIRAMLEAHLAAEKKVLASVLEWMEMADDEEQDFETYRMGQELVKDTEGDIQWASMQLAMIDEIGLQNYLQAQI